VIFKTIRLQALELIFYHVTF